MTQAQPTPPKAVKAPSSMRSAGLAVLASRILTLATGVLSVLILPLVLSPEAVGTFFLIQIFIAALAIVVQFGLTFTIPATITASIANDDLGRARKMLLLISAFVGSLGLAVAVVVALGSLIWLGLLDNEPPFLTQPVVLLVAITIPLAGMSTVVVEAVRAIHAPISAAMLGAFPGTALVIGLCAMLLLGIQTTIEAVLLLAAMGHLLAIMAGLGILIHHARDWPTAARERPDLGSLVRHAFPNLATTVALYGLSQLEMFLMASFGSLSDVANYGVALRLSALLLMPLSIANSAYSPLMVHQWTSGKREEMAAMLGRIVLVCFVLSITMYLGLAILGDIFVELWNPAYRQSYQISLVIGVGQIAHVLGGSSGVLLMLLGDQKAAFRIIFILGIFTLALCSAAAYLAGPLGLATAAALCNGLQVLLFTRRLSARFGIQASILAVIGNQRTWQAK